MIVQNVPIRNGTARNLAVCVEPWGERHELQPGESLRLVFYGPSGGNAEIVVDESDISVYGWQESRVFVVKDDICVSQPPLVDVIRRLFAAHNIDRTKVNLEPELIDYSQLELDASPAWDKNGQEAAFLAVSKLAPLISRLQNDALTWEFCEKVLHSRGVFLKKDPRRFGEFFKAIKKRRGNPFNVLTKWFEASIEFAGAAESVMGD